MPLNKILPTRTMLHLGTQWYCEYIHRRVVSLHTVNIVKLKWERISKHKQRLLFVDTYVQNVIFSFNSEDSFISTFTAV